MDALKKSSNGREDERVSNRLARLILAGARELISKDAMARNDKLAVVQQACQKAFDNAFDVPAGVDNTAYNDLKFELGDY